MNQTMFEYQNNCYIEEIKEMKKQQLQDSLGNKTNLTFVVSYGDGTKKIVFPH